LKLAYRLTETLQLSVDRLFASTLALRAGKETVAADSNLDRSAMESGRQ